MQTKYSIEDIKKVSPEKLLKVIQIAKEYLKRNKIVQQMFKDHEVPISYMDLIPCTFGDLKVSAKTVKGVITLNYSLLCDGNFFKDYSYLVHEILHNLQQLFGDNPTKSSNTGDYLHNKYEIEGFQYQVEFINDQFGEIAAEEYIDNLLDYHDKNGKERDKLKSKMTKKI